MAIEEVWHPSAPKRLRESLPFGKEEDGWRAWRRLVSERGRKERKRLRRLISLLEAGESASGDSRRVTRLVGGLASGGGKKAADAARAIAQLGQPGALEPLDAGRLALAGCYALPGLAGELEAEKWWRLFEVILGYVRDAAGLSLTEAPILKQMMAGELPLALGWLFPELATCRALGEGGANAIRDGVEELLDGEGVIQARYWGEFWGLLGCWTRVRLILAGGGNACPQLEEGKETNDLNFERQYSHVVRQGLRLAGPLMAQGGGEEDGGQKGIAELLRWGVAAAGNRTNRAIWKRQFECDEQEISGEGRLPRPGAHSEWAETAVLRTGWSSDGPGLAVTYGQRAVRARFADRGRVLFAGDWEVDVEVDGERRAPVGDWEEVCWVSDKDVDYLELEVELGGGYRLQRQMCLGHKDQFLFLADALLGGQEERRLSVAVRLPLDGQIEAEGNTETRELTLRVGELRALVLPLALPEWKADPRGGTLTAAEGVLELRQQGVARSLFAPLWIDLDRNRHKKAYTWRQATVGEQRAIQPRDVAVGYRIQFGKRQWLAYRSLGRIANRTLLGHNLATDFLIARFDRTGEVESLLEVE